MMNDEQFERKVKASLDNHVDGLDADTRRRLADCRRQALTSKSQPFAWLNINSYLPAGALALCSLFAIFLLFKPQDNAVRVLASDQVALYELLNNAEELEVMTDPDFYAWIDESLEDSLDKDTDFAS